MIDPRTADAIAWLREAFEDVGHWDSGGIAEGRRNLEIIVADAEHEARTAAWLAMFAAGTISGVNDVLRDAFGDKAVAEIVKFSPSADELLKEARRVTNGTR